MSFLLLQNHPIAPLFSLLLYLLIPVIGHTSDNSLSSYSAVYSASINGISIEITRVLETQVQGEYKLTLTASTPLLGFVESSSFKLDGGAIQALRYRYQGTGINTRARSSRFDWDTNKVHSIYKGKSYELSATKGLQDRLSWQEQIRWHLLNQTFTENKKVPSISLVSNKRIKKYHITYSGEETINTPLGTFNAAHYSKVQINSGREVHVWLAKDWDYLPLRVLQIEPNKKPGEIILKSAHLKGKIVSGL